MFKNRTEDYRQCIHEFTHGNCTQSSSNPAHREREYWRSCTIAKSKNEPHSIRRARFEAVLLDNITIEVNEL